MEHFHEGPDSSRHGALHNPNGKNLLFWFNLPKPQQSTFFKEMFLLGTWKWLDRDLQSIR